MGERPSQIPAAMMTDLTASPSAEGHDESPEKLSLKARLKLFEKEIEQQGSAAPAPKPGTEKTFTFGLFQYPGNLHSIIFF